MKQMRSICESQGLLLERKLNKEKLLDLYLSRLERTPDKREVGGSSPLKPI